MGVWNARIVVPESFEEIYSPRERALVLAHERAHLERRDVAVNVFATVWLCLSWFNPLMYWALGRLRFDQELACDE
jgi:bla regulator protein blaR1